MKHIPTLVLLMYLITLSNLFAQKIDLQSRKKLLTGTWVFRTNQYFDVLENDKVQAREGDQVEKTGTWKLSEDGHTFFILEEGEVVEEMNIVFVDEYQFAFSPKNSPEEVVFFKDGKEVSTKQKKKLILGIWEHDLNDYKYTYEFKKNGTGQVTENNLETDLKWKLSNDGSMLKIEIMDETRELHMKSIGPNRLIYVATGETDYEEFLTLKRK